MVRTDACVADGSCDVVGTTDLGCTVSVTMTNGLQKTPYVAIGEVEYYAANPFPLPGIDVAATVA